MSSGPVFEYFDKITKAGNCLYNATLFRIRQVLTLTEKPPEKWTDNEREVYDEILKALPLMPKKFAMPTGQKYSVIRISKCTSESVRQSRLQEGRTARPICTACH